jgi:hypothetical protein
LAKKIILDVQTLPHGQKISTIVIRVDGIVSPWVNFVTHELCFCGMRRFTFEKKANADVLACIVGGIFLPNMEVS